MLSFAKITTPIVEGVYVIAVHYQFGFTVVLIVLKIFWQT